MNAAAMTKRWWEIAPPRVAPAAVTPITCTSTKPFWCEAQAQRIGEARAAWQEWIDDLDSGLLPLDLGAIRLRYGFSGDCGCPLTGRDCKAPTGPRVAGCLLRPAP